MNIQWLEQLKKSRGLLLLEDYQGKTPDQVLSDFKGEWQAEPSEVDRFEVVIAYESVGCWGCDSSAWFLLREKSTGALYEGSGSHCSCYGFEGQFSPEPTHLDYLKSDKFSFGLGGYDNTRNYDKPDLTSNVAIVKQWIKANL